MAHVRCGRLSWIKLTRLHHEAQRPSNSRRPQILTCGHLSSSQSNRRPRKRGLALNVRDNISPRVDRASRKIWWFVALGVSLGLWSVIIKVVEVVLSKSLS